MVSSETYSAHTPRPGQESSLSSEPLAAVQSSMKNCRYLVRDEALKTRLPKDISSYRSSIRDPLTRPISDITDDYHNFGGGVNPLGKHGHTFTANGFGPVYTENKDDKAHRKAPPADKAPGASSSFDEIMDKISKLEQQQEEQERNKHHRGGRKNTAEKEKHATLEVVNVVLKPEPVYSPQRKVQADKKKSVSRSNADSVSSPANVPHSEHSSRGTLSDTNPELLTGDQLPPVDNSILGPTSPFSVPVSVSDLGASRVLGDAVYLLWRVLYFAVCMTAMIMLILKAHDRFGYAGIIAVTFAAFSSILSLRRTFQYWFHRDGRQDNGFNVHDVQFYSWFDVIVRQMTPVICLVVGLFSSAVYVILYKNLEWKIDYFSQISFYFVLSVTLMSLADIYLGMIPTRATYAYPSMFACLFALAWPSWGLRFDTFLIVVTLSALIGLLCGLLLHCVARIIWLIDNDKQLDDTPTAMQVV